MAINTSFSKFVRGVETVVRWMSGLSLAHLFAVTRWQERRIAQLEADNERLRQETWRWQQLVAEQAGRFAEERKDVLDRFVPRVAPQSETETGEPKQGWEELANDLGLNPIDRRIKQAQWEDELRYREQEAALREVFDEGIKADAENEENLRREFAERARRARANEQGAT